MYYYKGEKIGKFDVAYEKVFANKEMVHEIITDHINALSEEFAKDLLIRYIFSKDLLNVQSVIEDALQDLAEGWYGQYFKEPGELYERGDFAFEDWEGEE